MILLFYILALIFGIVIPLAIAIFGLFAILGDLKGAPYVPTSAKLVGEILDGADLKKGQKFLELGSGDGRIIRNAVRDFGVIGEGIEIHPLLVWYSNFLAHLRHLNAHFKTRDFYQMDFGGYDVIFVFLLPKTLKKLAPKFIKDCQKGTVVISHGFKIEGLEKQLFKTQNRQLFSTFFYRL